MKKIPIILVLMILLMSISSVVLAGEQIIVPSFDSVKLLAEQKAEALVQGYATTSIQYALISDGEIILSGNSGRFSKTEDKAITSDTMYGIGSISKIFTTAAIMKLVDDGKIELNNPVTNYIKEFKMEDNRYKDITVRMLLNHSSGLMGSSFNNAFLLNDNDTYAKDALLENLETQRLKADPGAFSVYCNDGFTLAELIVEEVSGVSFTEFISKNFTSVLGLNNTKTPMSDFNRDLLAKTYFPTIETSMPADTINIIGTGGIYSTAEDMVNFSQIFMDNPKGINGILTNESVEATMNKEYAKGMWAPEHDNLLGFGLGWDSVDAFPFNNYDIQAVVKGGDTLLYHGTLIILPEYNMAMAVLSSGGVSTYNQVFAQSILLETLKTEGHISDIKGDVISTPPVKAELPTEMLNYSGMYANSNMLIKAEISEDGLLALSIPSAPSNPAQSLVYTADGDFKSEDGSGAIGFVEETNGKIYMTNSGYSTLPGMGQMGVMEYMAQKIDSVILSDTVEAAWMERDKNAYYVLNEKYSSQNYLVGIPQAGVGFIEEAPGYLASNKIIDENKAVAVVEIPGVAGRDLFDFIFYMENGIEYMKYGSTILISHDYVSDIYTKGAAVCTIQKDGFARWFKFGVEDVGKKIIIETPRDSSFFLYDENQVCISYPTVTGRNIVEIPKNGTLVFVGDPGAQFNISYN